MTTEQKRKRAARWRRRNRDHIREHYRRWRKKDTKWWLMRAFLKAEGSPLDWPVYRERT